MKTDDHKWVLHAKAGYNLLEPINDIYRVADDCECNVCEKKRYRKKFKKIFIISNN